MKFVFPILAIFVCGAAAYFTLTQSEKFQENLDARLAAISGYKAIKASADKEGVALEEELKLLEESQKKVDIVAASVQVLGSDAKNFKNELAKVDGVLAAQDAEKEQLNQGLEQVQQMFADMNLGEEVSVDNLADKIALIEEDIKTKRIESEELEELIEGANKSLATIKKEGISHLEARKGARDARIRNNSLEARVTAVDTEWGFLVIGAGENSGFAPQTTLLVKRDGRLIGKVNPSAIEPTQTIAEIDPKSISPGVRIQPGDSVIIAQPATN